MQKLKNKKLKMQYKNDLQNIYLLELKIKYKYIRSVILI